MAAALSLIAPVRAAALDSAHLNDIDKPFLGPWVNGRWLNLFTGPVIWILVTLSFIRTVATVPPYTSVEEIVAIRGSSTVASVSWSSHRCDGCAARLRCR